MSRGKEVVAAARGVSRGKSVVVAARGGVSKGKPVVVAARVGLSRGKGVAVQTGGDRAVEIGAQLSLPTLVRNGKNMIFKSALGGGYRPD
ncbi:hypothetical protein RHMOL_Rhmol10G0225500 [Rhododendron molle]|uniref:Uncharacterized protein n=1 Tax=Rhododendron molle TaxID=49168 RepID=A0ACC0M584_RHOML|nr:hypothetical protein RHMOL_Rhmol10G0225500 [Rhododendron molle]